MVTSIHMHVTCCHSVSYPAPLQVVSAKIVAKSRTKQLRFGFVTMETPEEAERCIRELSGTELKGKKITVELVGHVTWGEVKITSPYFGSIILNALCFLWPVT